MKTENFILAPLISMIMTAIFIFSLEENKIEIINQDPIIINEPCQIDQNKVIVRAIVYAYNSEESQTDSDPFITASGVMTKDGIIANNCLDFGTKVKINGKEYEVQDRMNSVYGCEVFDIWFEEVGEAIKFGRNNLEVEILNN